MGEAITLREFTVIRSTYSQKQSERGRVQIHFHREKLADENVAREKLKSVEIRKCFPVSLNFDATDYADLINWDECPIT